MQTAQVFPFVGEQRLFTPQQAVSAKFQPEAIKEKVQILVIEHSAHLYEQLYISLEKRGYRVQRQATTDAPAYALLQRPQLVLIATSAPNFEGFKTCTELREKSLVPIVMLIDAYHPDTVIKAFELGADSVITTPFVLREVETRLAALLRRSYKVYFDVREQILSVGAITLNDSSHTVMVEDQLPELTPKEYQLLHYFMQHINQPLSKARLLQEIWRDELPMGSNLVEVAIRRLRQKIEKDPSHPQYLLTIRGVGYQFVQPNANFLTHAAD